MGEPVVSPYKVRCGSAAKSPTPTPVAGSLASLTDATPIERHPPGETELSRRPTATSAVSRFAARTKLAAPDALKLELVAKKSPPPGSARTPSALPEPDKGVPRVRATTRPPVACRLPIEGVRVALAIFCKRPRTVGAICSALGVPILQAPAQPPASTVGAAPADRACVLEGNEVAAGP